MTDGQHPYPSDGFLERMARFHRSKGWSAGGVLLSVSSLGIGVGLLIYTSSVVLEHGWSPRLDNLVLGILGLIGILVGLFVRAVLCLSRVTHEVLLRLDADYSRTCGIEAESLEERATSKSSENGSSFRALSKSDLRRLSTRHLTAGWRLVVMIPLVAGALLLVLGLGAWQVPRLGNLVIQYGARLEYLCLAGLVLMIIGVYLMPLA